MSSNFSVLMSIYAKENPEFLDLSLNSIYEGQSLKPTEIILIKDGPLTSELDQVIASYQEKLPAVLKVFPLEKNVGLGKALNYGLEKCTYELVARMDTDDIALSNRFELQVKFMEQNPDIDVSGTAVEEFMNEPGDLGLIRFSKEKHEDLIPYTRGRNPLNHPSVIYKKSMVMEAGSYLNMPLHEDYYLWIRMILKGAKLGNLKEPLLYFRIGNGMVSRRSGKNYMQAEYQFLKSIKEIGFINKFMFFGLLLVKTPFRLMPNSALTAVYKVLRKKRK